MLRVAAYDPQRSDARAADTHPTADPRVPTTGRSAGSAAAGGTRSLQRAAWAGLQDSMPRAALLSIHARVDGAGPSAWEDSLARAGVGAAVPRLRRRRRATSPCSRSAGSRTAARSAAGRRIWLLGVHALLAGARMRYDDAGRALGTHGNNLRYAALTGTLAIRWEGARRPLVWTVPPPEIERRGGDPRAGAPLPARLRPGRRRRRSPSGRASAPGRRSTRSTSSEPS